MCKAGFAGDDAPRAVFRKSTPRSPIYNPSIPLEFSPRISSSLLDETVSTVLLRYSGHIQGGEH